MYERDFACYKTMRETVACSRRNHIIDSMPKVSGMYERLRSKLEPRYKGHILAIEVESGEYVLGKDELKVALRR